jgi:hypothetical protein
MTFRMRGRREKDLWLSGTPEHAGISSNGGVHATLFQRGTVVQGDGDIAWPGVLEDCKDHSLKSVHAAGRIEASAVSLYRWDLFKFHDREPANVKVTS